MGTIGNHGYGHIHVPRVPYKRGANKTTHTAAYEAIHGPVPDGLCVLHKCDVRLCVNPAHLYLGDKKQNMKDAMSRGRWRHYMTGKTHCRRSLHKLDGDNLYLTRDGRRSCRACHEIARQKRVSA